MIDKTEILCYSYKSFSSTDINKEAKKMGKPVGEDFYRKSITVDSVGLRYNNPHLFGHEEFIDITLWRDSLNGIIVYGKW